MAVLVGLSAAGGVAAQEAATISATGWWTRSPLQQAPEDGFAVATAPDGTVTLAALMIETGRDGVSEATLEMEEAGGAGAVASLRACPTRSGWDPVAGGPLEEAPEPECHEERIVVDRGADGMWRVPVGALLSGHRGPVAIAVVPDDGSPALAFDVQLAKPRLVDVRGASEGSSPAPARSDAGAGAQNPAPHSGTRGPAPVQSMQGSAPALSTPPPEGVAAPAAPSAGTAVPGQTTPTETRGAFPLGAGIDEPRPWGRALVFVLLAGVTGVIAGIARRAVDA